MHDRHIYVHARHIKKRRNLPCRFEVPYQVGDIVWILRDREAFGMGEPPVEGFTPRT